MNHSDAGPGAGHAPAGSRGGPKKGPRWGWCLILGGAGAAALLVCCGGGAVALVLLGTDPYGTKIALKGGGELYYTPAVTEAEARKLADHLEREDNLLLGAKDTLERFQLNKAGGRYQFRIVVKEGKDRDPPAVILFRLYGTMLSKDVLAGTPVDVHLCDPHFRTLQAFEHLPTKT
jgi:hypothetical protein